MADTITLDSIRPEYWLFAGLLIGFAAISIGLASRSRPPLQSVALGLAAITLFRLLLVDNPFSWRLYARLVNPAEVGWRQNDIIRHKRDSFLAPPEPAEYLAVGSSQSGAMYGKYATQHAEFALFVVAGMMPMDFLLYEKEIRIRQPGTVLLYLSDFDIAKRESPEAVAVTPTVPTPTLLSIWRRSRTLPEPQAYDWALAFMAGGELFPEFKYRYVFQGLVDKPVLRLARRYGRSADADRKRSTEKERVQWIRESLSANYVEFNMAFLADFVGRMSEHGIRTVIVEGHYNPAVSNNRTAELSELTRERLIGLALGQPLVIYLPQSRIHCLEAKDYDDLTHVTERVGYEFTEALIRELESLKQSGEQEFEQQEMLSCGVKKIMG